VRRVLFAAATLLVAAVVSTTTQTRPEETAGPLGPSLPADAPLAYQGLVNKYCVGCHNTRNPLPAGAPLALDSANLADPGADPATWERVVRKLGVGAMPPQGSPTPGHDELTRFRSALVASLDGAAARTNHPGRYVLPG
jgi:mono/diheme cytochrome c family protein